MRNHGKTLDDAAELVEALIAHFRAACARYADAARGGEPRDEESSESDLDGGYLTETWQVALR